MQSGKEPQFATRRKSTDVLLGCNFRVPPPFIKMKDVELKYAARWEILAANLVEGVFKRVKKPRLSDSPQQYTIFV